MVVIDSSEVMKVPCGLLKLCYLISFSQNASPSQHTLGPLDLWGTKTVCNEQS